MILQVAAALLAVVAPTGSKERAPPAWRALQLAELPSELASGARGKLHGAPPCLRILRKVGWGHTARWRLGAYSDGEFACDVDFALDKNPDEPCCKLLFHADDAETGRSRRVGYMLLGAEADASALRGMHVREDLRGRGLSRLLLAVWLALCSEASLTPATKVINKPYLALTLQRFGARADQPARPGARLPGDAPPAELPRLAGRAREPRRRRVPLDLRAHRL